MKKILVTGACGQLGSELTTALINRFGQNSVVATDIRDQFETEAIYEKLDVLDREGIVACIERHRINEIYHLAAILSAKAEAKPIQAWDINMQSLLNILEISVEKNIQKVFWPSSIAVFGPNSPRINTPQHTVMDPGTVYGISKLAGERWMEYFNMKYGLDTRSIRYPGIISWKTLPGGGTTDYAIDIFVKAKANQPYKCFLAFDTELPMMFIDDAVRGTIDLMEAESNKLTIRSSYNLAAVSFTPEILYNKILEKNPKFFIAYEPDFRQNIADSWPKSIDDNQAREDWGWENHFGLDKLVDEMLENI